MDDSVTDTFRNRNHDVAIDVIIYFKTIPGIVNKAFNDFYRNCPVFPKIAFNFTPDVENPSSRSETPVLFVIVHAMESACLSIRIWPPSAPFAL